MSRHPLQLSAVFSFLAVTSLAAPALSGEAVVRREFIRGDTDETGTHNITDPIRILGYLFLGSPSELSCLDAADADDNGKLEITDSIVVLGWLFLGSREPAPPFPGCGLDETDDSLDCASFAGCGLTVDFPPEIVSQPPLSALEGQLYRYDVEARDPEGTAIVYALAAGPPGMIIADSTGLIEWTPQRQDVGEHDVVVSATDASNLAGFQSYRLRADPVNGPPVARNDTYNARIGEVLTVEPAGVLLNDFDPEGDTLTATLVDPPENGDLTFATDGSFRYTPRLPDPVAGLEPTVEYILDTFRVLPNSHQVMMTPGIADMNGDGMPDIVFNTFVGSAYTANGVLRVVSGDGKPRTKDVNLSLAAGVTIQVSSTFSASYAPERSIDGDRATSWFTARADRAGFYEIVFPSDVTVRRLRMLGNRESATGHDFRSGIFQILDAAGAILFDSGDSMLPAPTRDFALDVGQVEGARRVRFSGTSDDGTDSGFAELEVLGDGLPVGPEIWSVTEPTHATEPGAGVAIADIDGDHLPEIIAGHESGGILAFEHDGELKWQAPAPWRNVGYGSAAIADLEGDGSPEIIFGATVYDARGSVLWRGDTVGGLGSGSNGTGPLSVPVDLDLDGVLEVVAGKTAYRHDGALYWNSTIADGFASVANFDDDANPEIAVVAAGNVYLLEHTGAVRWGAVDVPGGGSGGAPTIADLDGDGRPEIGVAGARRYVAYEPDGAILWQKEIQDASSHRTGSSVFDFDGDGEVEVVYGDELNLRIYRGRDGEVLYELPKPSTTTFELPAIADVDADGHAEIVAAGNNYRYDGTAGLYVIGGARQNWVRTRKVWNQHAYHVTNVRGDTSVPAHPREHWLVPGLNCFRQQAIDPEDPEADTFTYRVSDGELAAEATVHVVTLPRNTAPSITSSPRRLATVGFPYTPHVLATDPDPGDALVFALVTGPAGMSIHPTTGVVSWTPSPEEAGSHDVTFKVTDGQGFYGLQAYLLEVGAPVRVPDLVGLTREEAEAALSGTGLNPGAVETATSPVVTAGVVMAQGVAAGSVVEPGSEVSLVLSSGPAPADVDDDGDGFSENAGDCDDANPDVRPGASDLPGNDIDEDCDGEDGRLPVERLIVSPAAVRAVTGEKTAFSATAVFADGTSQDVTSLAAWTSSNEAVATIDVRGVATAGAEGTADITATRDGASITASYTVAPPLPADAVPPVARIDSPAHNVLITGPIEVRGTATDDNFLRYDLAVAPAGESSFTTIASGFSPISGGLLGVFDGSLIANDLYTLKLTVRDRGGNETSARIGVQVDGARKLGIASLTFVDLVVPMDGLPITVVRRYDSGDKSRGDFGVGWQLDLRSLRVRTNRTLGTGWVVRKSRLAYALLPTDEHTVIVRLPDGLVEQFDLVITPDASAIVPLQAARASFRPRPGTTGTLEPAGNNNLLLLDPQPGEVWLYDDTTFDIYDPDLFRYTTAEGLSIFVSRSKGLQSARDANGNTLTVSAAGIQHSSGASVRFDRDKQGRITTVTDPNGNVQRYSYDAAGDLKSHQDAEDGATRFAYDSKHNLLSVRDPAGGEYRNEYDASGRLTALVDPAGRRVEVHHDLDANAELETDARGNSQVLRYDARGNVVSVEKTVTIEGVPVLARTTSTYDSFDNPLTTVDPDGETVANTYAGPDIVTEVLDPAGLRLTTEFGYDGDGRVTSTTDPRGNTMRIEYDSRGNLSAVVDRAGVRQSFVNDSKGRVLRRSDPSGGWTSFSYDSRGRTQKLESFSPEGAVLNSKAFTYDSNGNVLTESVLRNVRGTVKPAVTAYEYDGKNRRVKTIDPLGNTWTYEYDARGLLVAETNPRSHTTGYEHDRAGRLVRTLHPDGGVESLEYDPAGNIVRSIDADGRETRHEYDELDRRVATTFAGGAVERRVYTPGGRLAAIIDPDGRRTDFEYDAAGRRIARTGPEVLDGLTGARARPRTTEERDGIGQVTAVIDALGQRTAFERDATGRLRRMLFADGNETTWSHDALGRIASQKDEEGRTTEFEYDAVGRLSQVALPAVAPGSPTPITSYSYDPAGSLLQRTDPLGRITSYEYDEAGQVVSRSLPGNETESFAYDATGNLERHTTFNGLTTVFEHDARGRLTARRLPGGVTHAYAYFGSGLRRSMTGPEGTTTYAYDEAGRVKTRTQADGQAVTYSYDPSGRLLEIETAGRTVTYAYDEASRISRVIAPEGERTMRYDLADRLVRMESPGGVTTRIEHDQRGRVLFLEHVRGGQVLASFRHELSPSGLRRKVTEADGSIELYTYDGLGRLRSDTRTGRAPRSVAYEYDLAGNRTRMVRDGIETLYSYDSNDRLLSRTGATYEYDANGNRTSQTVGGVESELVWDPLDRLVEVHSVGRSTSFGYDPDGNRVSAEADGALRRYLVDSNNPTGYSQVLEERDESGVLRAARTFGRSVLSSTAAGESLHYHADAHGSTRLVTGAAGQIAGAYTFDGYGNLEDGLAGPAVEYLHAGERLDPTGLYHLRARYYDPAVGTFLSMDPFQGQPQDPVSLHRYLYARANPIQFVDPSGEQSVSELSVVNTIQTTLRRSEFLKKAKAVCSGAQKLSVAEDILLLQDVVTSLAFTMNSLFQFFAGHEAFQTEFVLVRLEWRRAREKGLKDLEFRLNPSRAAVVVAGTYQGGGKLNIEVGARGFGASGGRNVTLKEYGACGANSEKFSLGKLDLKIRGGVSSSNGKSYGAVGVGLELTTVNNAIKLTLPIAGVKFDGFDTATPGKAHFRLWWVPLDEATGAR